MNWLRAAACLAIAAAGTSPLRGTLLYTADTAMIDFAPPELWTVDSLTGEATPWPQPENLGPGSWNGLAVRTTEPGVIYAVNNPRPPVFEDPQTSRLARVDAATGSVTFFPLYDEAELGFPEPFTTSIAVKPGDTGTAYAAGFATRLADQRYLWQVDLATGAVLGPAVQIPDHTAIRAMTFDPTGETLWGADDAGRVFTINADTGELAVVGDTGLAGSIEGLEFDPFSGRLLAIEAGNGDRMVELDPQTGEVLESIGKLGIRGPEGLVFLTTPGDATGEGEVDLLDFNAMKGAFGTEGGLADGDFTRDGLVDLEDFAVLKLNFGATSPIPAPEPSSLAIAVLIGAAATLVRCLRN